MLPRCSWKFTSASNWQGVQVSGQAVDHRHLRCLQRIPSGRGRIGSSRRRASRHDPGAVADPARRSREEAGCRAGREDRLAAELRLEDRRVQGRKPSRGHAQGTRLFSGSLERSTSLQLAAADRSALRGCNHKRESAVRSSLTTLLFLLLARGTDTAFAERNQGHGLRRDRNVRK